MAYPNPDDPYRYNPADDDSRRAARRDSEFQPDPELSEEASTSNTKIALYALGAAIVLGFVFYGLNNSSVHEAGTTPPSKSAQSEPASPPPEPPGMRDVTPKANTNPGMTTGAAPDRPTPPTNPEVKRPAPPPAGTNDNPPAAPK
jgi:hypothetical protein